MPAPSLLSLPDSVIIDIFIHLVPEKILWTEKRGSPELVALATTCRQLSKHALDVLWQDIPSVIPLLMTLPPDLVAWSTVSYENPSNELEEVQVLVSRMSQNISGVAGWH